MNGLSGRLQARAARKTRVRSVHTNDSGAAIEPAYPVRAAGMIRESSEVTYAAKVREPLIPSAPRTKSRRPRRSCVARVVAARARLFPLGDIPAEWATTVRGGGRRVKRIRSATYAVDGDTRREPAPEHGRGGHGVTRLTYCSQWSSHAGLLPRPAPWSGLFLASTVLSSVRHLAD
jgi:hypothetical protein